MLTWVALVALLLFSGASFVAGRRKSVQSVGGRLVDLHSLPGYYGNYVALWTGVPAALIILLTLAFGARLEGAILRLDPPPAVSAMDDHGRSVFYDDAVALAHSAQRSETVYDGSAAAALSVKAAQAQDLEHKITTGSLAAAVVLSLSGLALAYRKINPAFRARNKVEGWIAALFIISSVTAILTTVGIVASLVWESWRFFEAVPVTSFLFGTDCLQLSLDLIVAFQIDREANGREHQYHAKHDLIDIRRQMHHPANKRHRNRRRRKRQKNPPRKKTGAIKLYRPDRRDKQIQNECRRPRHLRRHRQKCHHRQIPRRPAMSDRRIKNGDGEYGNDNEDRSWFHKIYGCRERDGACVPSHASQSKSARSTWTACRSRLLRYFLRISTGNSCNNPNVIFTG